MQINEQTSFIYRDFYDYARLIFFNHRGLGYILDSCFDDEKDEYDANYSIYVTQPMDYPDLQRLRTWTDNELKAHKNWSS